MEMIQVYVWYIHYVSHLDTTVLHHIMQWKQISSDFHSGKSCTFSCYTGLLSGLVWDSYRKYENKQFDPFNQEFMSL